MAKRNLVLQEILKRMKEHGFDASFFIFRNESTFSLVVGKFSEGELLSFGKKLMELQELYGNSLDISLKPRPNNPDQESIVITYASTWTVQFSKPTFRERLKILKEAITLWKLATLYIIHGSNLSPKQ